MMITVFKFQGCQSLLRMCMYDMNIYVDWKIEEGIKEGSKVRNFLCRRIIELECVSNVELRNVIRYSLFAQKSPIMNDNEKAKQTRSQQLSVSL